MHEPVYDVYNVYLMIDVQFFAKIQDLISMLEISKS